MRVKAMAMIDPEGLFGGDRLRRCSNAAQLHWPRLFLASNGFARIELNYSKLTGRAYANFNPVPSPEELGGYIREYLENSLLFPYEADGQTWGQWDTRPELLPKYKTALDRRSPAPPEPAFTEWKRRYRHDTKAFPKSFVNVSETFLHGVGVGVGVGVGKNICASPNGNARESGLFALVDNPPFETTEVGSTFGESKPKPKKTKTGAPILLPHQESWFTAAWGEYWRKKNKKQAQQAFRKAVPTDEVYRKVLAGIRAQRAEMLQNEPRYRPHFSTWLNGACWENEPESPIGAAAQSVPTMDDIALGREIDAAIAAEYPNPFANLNGRRAS
jgi:hypothetical protein